MTVHQGLTSITNAQPNFTNKLVQDNIDAANIGFVTKTKTLSNKMDTSTVLTDTQKDSLKASMNVQPHLSIGRYLQDLENHTTNMLNGTLFLEETANLTGTVTSTGGVGGANLLILDSSGTELKTIYGNDPTATSQVTIDPGSHSGNMPLSFFEYLGQVQATQDLHFTLYGTEAGSNGKGVDDHFGTLRGTMNNHLTNITASVQTITNNSLATDTAYQTATQNLINFIDSLDDSTYYDESTFNSLLSAFETAANNFNTTLSASVYSNIKSLLVEAQTTIAQQITSEYNNLISIQTYNESLTNILSYTSFTTNSKINDIIVKSAQNSAWKDYFNNYETRLNQINPLYDMASDSSEEDAINLALKLKNLPDVKNYLDTDSVAKKALRDTRIKTRLGDSGKTTEQIIEESCMLLGININGKDVYAQSKSLLENMNNFDRETVKYEISLHRLASTNS
jgi:hypothetical protein